MGENNLITQALAGNDQAFLGLIAPYESHLLKICFSFLKNTLDAEDACQEIIQKIHVGIPSYRGADFKAWISRIAANHCIDMLRKRQFMEIELEETRIGPQSNGVRNDNTLSPEQILISKETKDELKHIINALPVPYQEVIQLHYFSELSYREISQQLGIVERTVETRIYRARKMIARVWRKNAAL